MLSTYTLLFRAALLEILLLQVLEAPEALGLRWPWLILVSYGAATAVLFWLGRKRKLTDLASLASFLLDIMAAASTLLWLPGASTQFYVAYFLVILAACFLQRLLYSFIIGGVACVVYAGLTFQGAETLLEPGHWLRLSLLLSTSLFGAFVSESVRRAEQSAEDVRQKRMAWMERLSSVGKAMSGVIHELKSPMGTILMSAEYVQELLERPDGKDEAVRRLDIIKEEAERAGAMLADFLNFARPADLELKPLTLEAPLKKALEKLSLRLDDAGVRLDARLDESTIVLGNEPHLLQVFLNILNNAIDAMLIGGTLTVEERRHADRIDIVVRDTGLGIAPEMLERVFEPFETTKAGTGGHGIGLYVARWIAQKHGGDIRVWSAGLKKGTEITVTLPLPRPGS
ncbi:MAG: HAMP domain-containing sensor histidine kinase [Elusimicrobiota bacterium]